MNRVTLGSFVASERAKKLVMEVLDSGRLSYGEKSAEYERKFAALHGCEYGVVSNSGTSSLHVAIQALKEINEWPDGAEVIVPALTFVATVNVILHNNLEPVFVDVGFEDYCIDTTKIVGAITSKTVAIMPVHLFGHPANMPCILSIAEEYNLKIVEDCCEAMLARHGGVPVGAWGDVGCFSTYAAHHMVTGVGGMAVTKDERLALHMRSLVNHGIALGGLPTGERYDPSFLARKFTFDKIGHSFRITELEAAIGLAQIDVVEDHVEVRRQNASMITEAMGNMKIPAFLPREKEGCFHSWMVYPILLSKEVSRDEVMGKLNSMGIETRFMMPLINQPCYEELGIAQGRFPIAEYINSYGFYVGCHQDLTLADISYLINSVGMSVLEHAK